MSTLFWLASYPKSGNTWLRAFLANLLANRPEPLPLKALSQYCDDEARPERYSALAGRPSHELSLGELCALRAEVQAQIAAAGPGTRFVKTHNCAGVYDGYPLHHPQLTVGAVYVVRNPLDVAISMADHFGLSLDAAIERLASEHTGTANDALFVTQVLGSWSQHVASWADKAGPRVLIVRYEDLLLKPAKHFAKIAKLVGLDRDRARIERAIRHARFDSLARDERQHGFIEAADSRRAFFRVGRAHQWREALSREQIQRIVDAHREQMARFDYLPPGY